MGRHIGSCGPLNRNFPKKWPASSEASGRSDMIFIDNAQSFEKYIMNNKKVTIGVTFYQSGEQGFDFDVSDYPGQAKR